jgi:hypothetical protein
LGAKETAMIENSPSFVVDDLKYEGKDKNSQVNRAKSPINMSILATASVEHHSISDLVGQDVG